MLGRLHANTVPLLTKLVQTTVATLGQYSGKVGLHQNIKPSLAVILNVFSSAMLFKAQLLKLHSHPPVTSWDEKINLNPSLQTYVI